MKKYFEFIQKIYNIYPDYTVRTLGVEIHAGFPRYYIELKNDSGVLVRADMNAFNKEEIDITTTTKTQL